MYDKEYFKIVTLEELKHANFSVFHKKILMKIFDDRFSVDQLAALSTDHCRSRLSAQLLQQAEIITIVC